MNINDLIKDLEEIRANQGDDTIVWIDVPERDSFSTEFCLSGKWYQGNTNPEKNNRCYIVIEDKDE